MYVKVHTLSINLSMYVKCKHVNSNTCVDKKKEEEEEEDNNDDDKEDNDKEEYKAYIKNIKCATYVNKKECNVMSSHIM